MITKFREKNPRNSVSRNEISFVPDAMAPILTSAGHADGVRPPIGPPNYRELIFSLKFFREVSGQLPTCGFPILVFFHLVWIPYLLSDLLSPLSDLLSPLSDLLSPRSDLN